MMPAVEQQPLLRVWIDGQCLQTVSRLRGIGRYVLEFVRAIASRPEVELSISFNAAMADELIAARALVSNLLEERNIHIWQGVAEGGEAMLGRTPLRRLSEIAIAHHVACLDPDVALSASPFEGSDDKAVPYLARFSHQVPTVAIFYDAIPHRFQEQYLTSRRRANFYHSRLKTLSTVDQLLAISDFAKREAHDLLPELATVSINAGFSLNVPKSAVEPAIANLDSFVLYVGGFDWRKNIGCVITAFSLLSDKLQLELKFVVVGDTAPELSAAIEKQWRELGLPEVNLRILGRVNDDTLAHLYSRTRVLVQPSFMEGFGLTAIEAMACGAPIVAARAGALPEVVGDHRSLFDPHDPRELAQKLTAIVSNQSLRADLIKVGLQQAARFTWEATSNAATDAMRALAQGKPGSDPSAAPNAQRVTTRKHLARLAIKRDLAAKVLAAAEPLAFRRRLLIDVTATCRIDHATGIQRVVNKISRVLTSDAQKHPRRELQLVYSDSDEAFYVARHDASKKLHFAGKHIDNRVLLNGGDHIVMLDSSWEFHREHCSILRKARLRGCRVTSVLYDLVPIRMPAFCDPGMPIIFSQWLRSALSYSSGFMCISKAVADELLALLAAIQYPRKIHVGYWHLGGDLSERSCLPSAESSAPRLRSVSPVYLMVGTLEPRKGYHVALRAFNKLWNEGFNGSLCIAGKRGWGTSQLAIDIESHPEFGNRLQWREAASDEELEKLYRNCDALISASYGEGFGLPIVEAAHYGKPILASDIPVFREIATSSTTMFFLAGSVDALASAIQTHAGLTTVGGSVRINAPSLSWGESAERFLNVISENNWYKTYEPIFKDNQGIVSMDNIGQMKTESPLAEGDRQHQIALVEGPTTDLAAKTINIVLKITNLSRHLWSSVGDEKGQLGVALSYHLSGANGANVQYDNPRTSIPFVLGPGDHIYLGVTIASSILGRGIQFIDFELVQEGVAWFGNPLRVVL